MAVYSKEEHLKKILIVDDLKPSVEQQKSILSRSDVHMFTATSGPEALSTHRNVKAALMVTDLDMPGMAGDELCSIIRKDPDLRFVSILIVTRPREADIARCKNVEPMIILQNLLIQIAFSKKPLHFLVCHYEGLTGYLLM